MATPLPLEPGKTFDERFTREMTTAERMHLVMTRLDYIQKDKPKEAEAGGKALRYSIVSHDKVTAMVREHTVACGLIYWPHSFVVQRDGNITMVHLKVTFRSIHDADDEIIVDGLGYGIDPGDKGPGKAISYAVKYALLKGFGLETGDDPDFDQEVQRRSSTQQRADQLELSIQGSADSLSLRSLLEDPTTVAVLQALFAEDQPAWRVLRQKAAAKAKAVGLDLSTVGQTDA